MGMDLADMEQRVTELNELSNIYSLICSDNGSVLYQSAYLKMLQSQLRQEISYFESLIRSVKSVNSDIN